MTLREGIALYCKGLAMGTADIIPGVSGGTVAFITGIYEQLLAAIRSVDAGVFSRLVRLDVRGAMARVHWRFLLALGAGVLTALVAASRVVHHLLEAYPVQVWALFFGLILASALVVWRHLPSPGLREGLFCLVGAVGAYVAVGLIPVETPQTLWFFFFCGIIAICAMILPGLSGAFLLLVLGKYAELTGALRNPLDGENLLIIMVFGAGACIGLALFSRVLGYLFARYHDVTVALLTGLMLGALRRVWPWKDVLETRVIGGKERIVDVANTWPRGDTAEVGVALGLMVLGIVLVLALEFRGRPGGKRVEQ